MDPINTQVLGSAIARFPYFITSFINRWHIAAEGYVIMSTIYISNIAKPIMYMILYGAHLLIHQVPLHGILQVDRDMIILT